MEVGKFYNGKIYLNMQKPQGNLKLNIVVTNDGSCYLTVILCTWHRIPLFHSKSTKLSETPWLKFKTIVFYELQRLFFFKKKTAYKAF